MCLFQIFSPSLSCLPIFLSFTEQKFLTLMKSNLSIISFMDHVFVVLSKKRHHNTQSHRFSPVLFSRSFIVLHFTVRSMIHFKLIFVKGVRSLSRLFFFLYVNVQLFQHQLLKRLSLFHCIAFALVSKISRLLFVGVCFWTLYSVLLIYLFILSPVPHCLDYRSYIVSLEVG